MPNVVCRTCKYSTRKRPDNKKMVSGRLWCICYRREMSANKTCPKAAPADTSAPTSMMRKKIQRPGSKNAFIK